MPVYRNAQTLRALVDRIHAALDPHEIDHVVLFVDDASPDDGWQVIAGMCAVDRRVAAVSLERNSGQHRAILVGFASARGNWLAVMDADLQDPPEALPQLLAKARSTQGAVFGTRSGRHQRWSRRMGSALYKTLLWLLTGAPRRCGTFFVVPGAVAAAVSRYEVTHPQVVVMTCSASPRIATVPFTRTRREIGRSAYDLRRLVAAACRGLRCAIECRRGPLQSACARGWAPVGKLAGQAWRHGSR